MQPDCTGDYLAAGDYNGRVYAVRTDGSYTIWCSTSGYYSIGASLGSSAWKQPTAGYSITNPGTYYPESGAGYPVVHEYL